MGSGRAAVFVVLEGLDGAGTTTQAERLVRWLESRGRRPVATREPSDGPVGRLVRRFLRGEEGGADAGTLALLFAADRLDHLAREVRPALAAGRDVVSDRYVLSSLAYQAVENDGGWVEALNARADEPDLTILLDVPVSVGMARVGERGGERDLYEREEFLEQVAEGYRKRATALAARGKLVVIDGTRSVDEVSAAVGAEVSARFGL